MTYENLIFLLNQVLNKADLVPRESLEQWVKYLKVELPTVAVKCSTYVQRVQHGKVKIDQNAENHQVTVRVH